MLKKIFIYSFATGALICSLNSYAAKALDHGFYLDANAGYGKVNEVAQYATENNNTGFAWNINAGMKLNPNFALEIGFYSFPNEKFSVNGYQVAEGSDNFAGSLAMKGICPIVDSVSLFGKFGAAMTHHRFSDTGYYYEYENVGSHGGLAALVGAGLNFAVTDNVAIVVQGVAISKSSDNTPPMYLGSLGLSYTFG